MTLYPDIVQRVINACRRYRQEEIAVDELQACIWDAACEITALEDREIRALLQSIEGNLEIVQFTSDGDDARSNTMRIVDRLEAYLQDVL